MTMDILSMQFFAALGSIVLLDVLLGGDNAVVIAMAANKLPAELRKKEVLIGTAGAVIIRLVMTMLDDHAGCLADDDSLFAGPGRSYPAADCRETTAAGGCAG
ncbi:TerC family protein [uncultured Megasphaera sp.]|uniref:TerC family protein n=1 Tax=uncultured Megasphaera sp. TaxID=165188 RepID=UPI0025F19CEC|nr:hypothetical protein [uncultured Megasphaera sp.]